MKTTVQYKTCGMKITWEEPESPDFIECAPTEDEMINLVKAMCRRRDDKVAE